MKVNKVFKAGLLVVAAAPAILAEDPNTATGKKLYETNCGTCHQLDGSGVLFL